MATKVTLKQLLDRIPKEKQGQLDQQVEDRVIVARVAATIPDWTIAANFFTGVYPPEIQAIKHNNQLSYEQQRIGLIDKWIERNGQRATYRSLAECLFAAGCVNSVDTLCNELGASTPPPAVAKSGAAVPAPTMKQLMNNVHTDKTFELGIQLDLDLADVKTVMADNKNDTSSQLVKILTLYLEQTEEPSWLHVATALYAIGEQACAANIEKKFGVCVPPADIPSIHQYNVPKPVIPDFKKTVSKGERVKIIMLAGFQSPSGTINILQRVGPDYKPLLGNILLKSEDGQRIRALEMSHSNRVDDIVYEMFQKWCVEDDDCTWGALVHHLKQTRLRTLANDIESALL